LLLFATKNNGRMAIPLSLVDRLEEFPRSALERTGSLDVVQYRDQILPLIEVADALSHIAGTRKRRASRFSAVDAPNARHSERVQVVVVGGQDQRVGLVVDQILDVAEETLVARASARRLGVLFNAVIQGRVTEFLDVERIARLAGSAGAREQAVGAES
jgi:two-component system chemotaxis sensor kinase CheA